MITYFAINLDSKRFQVGSTTNFDRRYREHLNSDMNPEFHRALQKRPERFFWLVSEDDGLDTREEEQFYLDFYHGTMWCYNINPSATNPPSTVGIKWWNNGLEQIKSYECPGEEWTLGRVDSWWTNGKRNTISMDCPGEGWTLGRVVTPRQAEKMSRSGKGNVWWCNGETETRSKTSPGEGWVPGRLPKPEGKIAWTDGENNTFSFDCPGEGWYRGITLTEEQRRKYGDPHRGKKYGKRDPSVGKKISEKNRGRKFTEEHKRAIAEGRAKIPIMVCEICGKEIRCGIGNLRQHMRKHQRED